MGLEQIPVLPNDYPLFDWSPWQSSRDALVSGTPTKHFAKEAWNYIVDTLNAALEEAGLKWYDPRFHDSLKEIPYTIEDSKILKPYGQLKASTFNNVADNVDQATALRWAWDYNPNFRGYVGKNRFKGTTVKYDYYGNLESFVLGDTVYPEYIIELSRRINLMIELMRGTQPVTETRASHTAQSFVSQPGTKSLRGARIQKEHLSHTKGDPKIVSLKAEILEVENKLGYSEQEVDLKKVPAAGIERWVDSSTWIDIGGRVRSSLPIRPKTAQGHTKTSVEMYHFKMSFVEVEAQIFSDEFVEIDKAQPTCCSAQVTPNSSSYSVMSKEQSAALEGEVSSRTKVQPDLGSKESLLASATQKVTSLAVVLSIDRTISAFLEQTIRSCSSTEALAHKSFAINTRAEALILSKADVETQQGKSVATHTEAQSSSVSRVTANQSEAKEVSGSENLSLSESRVTLMPIRGFTVPESSHKGETQVQCSLDTGWLPPVWTNGGLWIRQAYAITQNEDGSLEVV